MSRIIEILLVVIYNLALLAGASYLIIEHNFSAWIYLLALIFAAGWKEKGKTMVEA